MPTKTIPKETVQTKIIQDGHWLTLEFREPHQILSWAVVNGGMTQSRHMAWYKVDENDMGRGMDPRVFLKEKLKQKGIDDAVGLLTSADLESFVDVEKDFCQNSARCITTVGMSNALRIGDLPTSSKHIGTINLMVQLSAPLSDEAFVEAIAMAAEARTAAVLESRYPSIRNEEPATGTGTDCIAIAAPVSENHRQYAGKHTDIGYLIGTVVYEAICKGVTQWKKIIQINKTMFGG